MSITGTGGLIYEFTDDISINGISVTLDTGGASWSSDDISGADGEFSTPDVLVLSDSSANSGGGGSYVRVTWSGSTTGTVDDIDLSDNDVLTNTDVRFTAPTGVSWSAVLLDGAPPGGNPTTTAVTVNASGAITFSISNAITKLNDMIGNVDDPISGITPSSVTNYLSGGTVSGADQRVKADVTRFYLYNLFGFYGGADLLANEDTVTNNVGELIDASENLTNRTVELLSAFYTTPSMSAPTPPSAANAQYLADMSGVLGALRTAAADASNGEISASVTVSDYQDYEIPTASLKYQHIIKVNYDPANAKGTGSSDTIVAQGTAAWRTYGFQFEVSNAINYS
jgi:hypothetical protein